MKLRVGTKVKILTGKDRGKEGSIERVMAKTERVVVTGLNLAKRHLKPSKQHPAGGIVETAMPIHQSNVKPIEDK